jgi:uncharacterized protein (DUF2062 family)
MAKDFLKKYIPSQEELKSNKSLAFLHKFIHDPNLWHSNRHSISGAFAVGLFIAWVPVPFQMVLAAIFAIIFRVNLPISIALVWFTNPLTMPPMFYAAYRFGLWVLNQQSAIESFEFSYVWLEQSLSLIWQPFLLGCFIIGIFTSFTSYLLVRILWRYKVVTRWKNRKH